jgi:hypothetical protein
MFLYGILTHPLNDEPTEYQSSYMAVPQAWPTSTHKKPHDSLRTGLKAALVYTYIEGGGGVEFTCTSLFTKNKLR